MKRPTIWPLNRPPSKRNSDLLFGIQFSVFRQLLLVTILVKIGRSDLAQAKLAKLKKNFLDEVAFQMVESEVALSRGGSLIKEAVYIYQELLETQSRTPKLLHSLTGALIMAGRHSEAEQLIMEALQKVSLYQLSVRSSLESARFICIVTFD